MRYDTKTALLDSAEQAVRARGFDAFSYATLAEDVGIRKASIHHHFPTKSILSIKLIQRYSDHFAAVCADINETGQTGGARLDMLITQYRKAIDQGKSLCLCVSLSTSRASLAPDVIHQISSFRQMLTDWLEATFAAGQKDGTIKQVQDPAQEASATLSVLEGAQIAARAEEKPELFDTSLKLLTSRIQVARTQSETL